MTSTISAITAGAAFAQFMKVHAILHTHNSMVREDEGLPERTLNAIGTLIDARLTGVGGSVQLNWVQSMWVTKGNCLTLSQNQPLGALLAWVTNDERSLLLRIDTLDVPFGKYVVTVTSDRMWLNDDTIWALR
jgi:hypothetical protein